MADAARRERSRSGPAMTSMVAAAIAHRPATTRTGATSSTATAINRYGAPHNADTTTISATVPDVVPDLSWCATNTTNRVWVQLCPDAIAG